MLMIRETDSNLYRDSRNRSNLYHRNKTVQKPNMDKTILGGRPDTNLENSFFSESPWGKDFGRNQQLFDKNSSSSDAMRSITLPNEKNNAYIDNLNNQQQQGKQIKTILLLTLYSTNFTKGLLPK